jgi:hypothetical protein
MESDLLAVWHRACDSTSTLAIRAQRGRVAAEWSESAGEAVAQFRGRKCEAGELIEQMGGHIALGRLQIHSKDRAGRIG